MAIAFDASSNRPEGTVTGTPPVYSWSHTCTGSNLVLVVGIVTRDLTDADRLTASITYNGVSLTKIREDDNLTDDNTTSLWYLLNPATGANTIEVTGNSSSITSAIGMAVSLTGVAQSGQPDANNGNIYSNANSITDSVTTVADNCWVVDAVCLDGPQTLAVGSGQTQRENVTSTASSGGMSTEGPKTPGGAVAMEWNDNGEAGSPDWSHSAASFSPAITAATLDQKHYRFFDDDVSLNGATALANEDTNISGVNTLDNFRVRYEVANTGGASGTITRQAEWRAVGGTWVALGTTTTIPVYITLSSVFADGDATTARLTAVGTFQAGQGKESGSQTSVGTLAASYNTEDEWNIVFGTAAIAGQAYEFRITNQGTALDAYTKYGTATVFAAGPSILGWKTLLGVGQG